MWWWRIRVADRPTRRWHRALHRVLYGPENWMEMPAYVGGTAQAAVHRARRFGPVMLYEPYWMLLDPPFTAGSPSDPPGARTG